MREHVRDVSILRVRPRTAGLGSVFVEGVGRVQEEVRHGAAFTVQKHRRHREYPECVGGQVVDFVHVRQVEEPDLSPRLHPQQQQLSPGWAGWETARLGHARDLGLVQQQPRLGENTVSVPSVLTV